MNKNIRDSGIKIIGNIPWGTHFCQFYQTKQDFLDIIIPYFKAGLENSEFCIWVTPQPLEVEEAKETLKMAISDLDTYLDKGQIEIIPYNDWYLTEGAFDSRKALEGLIDKLNQALSNGYDGLRLAQNAFRQKDDLDSFINYEEKLNSITGKYPITMLCTYEFGKLNPINIIEIATNHDFSLNKKNDNWEQLKNSRQENIEERIRDKNFSTAINSINQIIHSTLDFDEIMKRTVSEAAKVIGSDTAAISLRKGERWIVSYVYGFPENVIGAEMNDEEERHAVLAIKTKKPVAVNDAFNDERVNRNHMKKWGVRSVLVAPLTTKDKVIGVIFFNFHKSIFVFDNSHIDFAIQLAASVSLALENSSLFKNLEMELIKRKRVEEDLREAYEEIQTQSKELQAQSEELQAQNKEIHKDYLALSESENRYRELFINMTEGFLLGEIICDKDGKPYDYRYLEINPAFESHTTIKRELVLGKTALEVFHSVPEIEIKEFGKVALSGGSTHFEVYAPSVDRYFEIHSFSPEKGKFAAIFRNVTHRKRIKEALHLSEERFRLALQNTPVVVANLDRDLRYTWIYNTKGGFSPEEVLGKKVGISTSPEDTENIVKYLRETLTTGVPSEWETASKTKTGDRFFESYAEPLRNADGEITGIGLVSIDITERKRAEVKIQKLMESVQQEKDRLSALINSIPDEVWFADAQKKITLVNPAVLKEFGSTFDEPDVETIARRSEVYRPDGTLRPVDEAPPLRVLKGEVIKNQEEIVRIPATGELRYRQVNAVPVKDTSGNIIGSVSVVRDITELKKAEESLRKLNEKLEEKVKERTADLEKAYNSLKESEKSLAEAQNMAHIGNWDWNIVTGEVYWSDELYRIFGRNPQESGATYPEFLNYVHPSYQEHVNDAVKKALIGEPIEGDYRVILANGEERLVHTRAEVIFDEKNIPTQMIGIVQDITERKQMEEALELLARLPQENPNSVMRLSKDFVINYANPAAQVLLTDWDSAIGKEAPATIKELANAALRDGARHKIELKYADHTYLIILVPFPQAGYVNLYADDITELKVAEEEMAKLDEARIKEIHHRIKNNLQVISSLIDLQAETFSNLKTYKISKVLEAFKESQNRVISMALIHEELYKGRGSENLDFAAYLRKLTTNLVNSYNLKTDNISLKLNFEEVYLDMDAAIPLGMIVNELVSNSLKHAFPNGKKPEISIILQRADSFTFSRESLESDNKCKENDFCFALTVADNGKGIPKEINLQTVDSLGLQLVNILVEQIDGCMEIKRDNGTEFIIWFNDIEN